MENLYSNITLAAPTTTVVCSKPCVLSGITINKTTANGVITVYDGTSVATGTVVATITSPATLLHSQISLKYDICLNKGLTIVTSTAEQNITVAYKV